MTRAVLTARGVDTSYARMGAGPPLLLLRADGGDDTAAPIVAALAARFRVIAPLRPASIDPEATGALAAWLRDLVDGLGIECLGLVADAVLGPAALAFAVDDPLRVTRLAVLVPDGSDTAARDVAVGVVGNDGDLVRFLTAGGD